MICMIVGQVQQEIDHYTLYMYNMRLKTGTKIELLAFAMYYAIVINWESRNYGSKRTDPKSAAAITN